MLYALLGMPLVAPRQPAQKFLSRGREAGRDAGGLALSLAGGSCVVAISKLASRLLTKAWLSSLIAGLLEQQHASSAGS